MKPQGTFLDWESKVSYSLKTGEPKQLPSKSFSIKRKSTQLLAKRSSQFVKELAKYSTLQLEQQQEISSSDSSSLASGQAERHNNEKGKQRQYTGNP
jgi:hypothetical protein